MRCTAIALAALTTATLATPALADAPTTLYERQLKDFADCVRQYGEFTPEDCPGAFRWRVCAAGEQLVSNGRTLEDRRYGYRLCVQAAQEGLVSAQATLGQYYLRGIEGVAKRDFAAAKAWLQLAANAGHPVAEYNLAMMYLMGDAGQTDREKAFALLRSSGLRGNSRAQLQLGKEMLNDALHPVEKKLDLEKGLEAMFWYCLAAGDLRSPDQKSAQEQCDFVASLIPNELTRTTWARVVETRATGIRDPREVAKP